MSADCRKLPVPGDTTTRHVGVESIGEIANSRDRTRVVAPHGGQVVEWLVEDGDLVSPGQPLLRLHPEGTA